MPVPPPVTTAEKLETSKSLELLSSSLDLTEGLSEDIVLMTVRFEVLGKDLEVLGKELKVAFRAAIAMVLVRSLSMVVVLRFAWKTRGRWFEVVARHDVCRNDVESALLAEMSRKTAHSWYVAEAAE